MLVEAVEAHWLVVPPEPVVLVAEQTVEQILRRLDLRAPLTLVEVVVQAQALIF
jgi:hypothetical protein